MFGEMFKELKETLLDRETGPTIEQSAESHLYVPDWRQSDYLAGAQNFDNLLTFHPDWVVDELTEEELNSPTAIPSRATERHLGLVHSAIEAEDPGEDRANLRSVSTSGQQPDNDLSLAEIRQAIDQSIHSFNPEANSAQQTSRPAPVEAAPHVQPDNDLSLDEARRAVEAA